MDANKEKLIEIFRNKVKGKAPNISGRNVRHDGRKGNWLEEQFGKLPDADNHADFWGYELKSNTTSKTTFGDWSANRYIYRDGAYTYLFDGKKSHEKKDSFCQIFGAPNPEKNNRYSWSGRPVPKISGYNEFGQVLRIDKNLDILAVYSYSMDMRPDKAQIVPKELQQDNLIIAQWFGVNSPTTRPRDKCLKAKLEDKFNVLGWFTCKTDDRGRYEKICFGQPIDYNTWIHLVHIGVVFLDSGMYEGNERPYSQWRASNQYWDSLIVECYT